MRCSYCVPSFEPSALPRHKPTQLPLIAHIARMGPNITATLGGHGYVCEVCEVCVLVRRDKVIESCYWPVSLSFLPPFPVLPPSPPRYHPTFFLVNTKETIPTRRIGLSHFLPFPVKLAFATLSHNTIPSLQLTFSSLPSLSTILNLFQTESPTSSDTHTRRQARGALRCERSGWPAADCLWFSLSAPFV